MDNLNGDDCGDVPQEVHDNGVESTEFESNGVPVDEQESAPAPAQGAGDEEQDDSDRPVVELFVKVCCVQVCTDLA